MQHLSTVMWETRVDACIIIFAILAWQVRIGLGGIRFADITLEDADFEID